ncbi:MAG: hypothetical protein GC154_06805 [bacterium]|nr:hypothetical protein [bacterium]
MTQRLTVSVLFPCFLAAAGLLFLGCDPEKESIENFPHKPHIEQEISCDTCHAVEAEGIAMPTLDTCLTCHDVEEDEAYNRCSTCHDKVDVHLSNDMGEKVVQHQKIFSKLIPKEWADVKYKHAEYWEDTENCLLCHTNIASAMGSSLDNLPSMKTAISVQEQFGFSTECSVCHLEINKLNPPASHDKSWEKMHGRMAVFSNKQDCLMCHQEATCQACHEVQKPDNHTSLFRRQTHGLLASFDRDKCQTCHRVDECETCHRASAQPIPAASYHTPDASCLTCHDPMAAQGPSPRPPQRLFKPMPHRLMMGVTSQKCLECHSF